jgi:hypothetical protein
LGFHLLSLDFWAGPGIVLEAEHSDSVSPLRDGRESRHIEPVKDRLVLPRETNCPPATTCATQAQGTTLRETDARQNRASDCDVAQIRTRIALSRDNIRRFGHPLKAHCDFPCRFWTAEVRQSRTLPVSTSGAFSELNIRAMHAIFLKHGQRHSTKP